MQSTVHTTADAVPLEDLYSIEDLAAQYPKILSVAILRWQLRSRHRNGLAQCCVPLGKRLLISKSRYERWLSAQALNGGAAA